MFGRINQLVESTCCPLGTRLDHYNHLVSTNQWVSRTECKNDLVGVDVPFTLVDLTFDLVTLTLNRHFSWTIVIAKFFSDVVCTVPCKKSV